MIERLRIKVTGVVQGVGFRPFVYDLAAKNHLTGYVLNDSQGVEIEIEGGKASIDSFVQTLQSSPPTLSRIKKIEFIPVEPEGTQSFDILQSQKQDTQSVLISPDYATCPDCVNELFDPANRRYRFPFINCTNCGPRYTIIYDLPYDRSRTTMNKFEMCPKCRAEYEDPLNRRFHAEPTCCHRCGPSIWLADENGQKVETDDPIQSCLNYLKDGKIIAIKGLGGFHLACDATSNDAVRELRKQKMREEKPFAVMVQNMEAAKELATVTTQDEATLDSPQKPIVLLPKKNKSIISTLVAPKSRNLGIMLPYTPLHHLLMQGSNKALIMTSANLTDEPIAYQNDDALKRLHTIADYFLFHDRDIFIRTDDSVTHKSAGEYRFLRRSRGYAPFPMELPAFSDKYNILAVGPELKNTICLTQGKNAFVSHYIGDLRNAHAYQAFLQAIGHLENVLEITPDIIACDTHPDYLSTRYAKEQDLPIIAVQHHHAHITSVLAEKGRTDKVIGVSFDGLGWGEQDEIWGGEFLTCDLSGFERAGHLELEPQPGGDAAAKSPPRMAYVYLKRAFGDRAEKLTQELFPDMEDEFRIVSQMIEKRINCPLTSSAGRLFDAVSAILQVCRKNTYEGQAPMELEGGAAEAEDDNTSYPVELIDNTNGAFTIRTSKIIHGLVEDFLGSSPREVCAQRFHNSIAQLILESCQWIRRYNSLSTVVLSGGVFANALLTEKTKTLLESEGFEVLLNSIVPAGDGGVSLGQAVVAAWKLSHKNIE